MPFVFRQAFGNLYYVPWPNGSYDENFVEELEHIFMLHPASNKLPLARRVKAGMKEKTPSPNPWENLPNEELIGNGYSGTNSNRSGHNPKLIRGQNNPDDQEIGFVGPIPRGRYTISDVDPHSSKGPNVMHVTPLAKSASYPGTNTFGRTQFLIHGPNKNHMTDSSEGCIVLDPNYRKRIINLIKTWQDRLLIVTK